MIKLIELSHITLCCCFRKNTPMTEHFAQGKFRRGLKCKQDLVLSHLRGVLYLHVPFRIELEFKNREFEKRFFWATRVNRKLTFFQSWGVILFRQIDSVREKIRRNTNLLASRHIKREKDSLPVDVCLPKTSLLKRRTIRKVMGGRGGGFSSGRNFVRYQIPCMNFS